MVEQKDKFTRKIMREEAFKYSTTKLGHRMEQVIKQN